MIERPRALAAIDGTLRRVPVCALLGPRQCGKTTLARMFARERTDAHFFDLELAADRTRLASPELALSPLRGLVIIDEVQRLPSLFTVLRPLVDRPSARARFLLLGSASPSLVRGVSESLAGRVGFVDLGGLGLDEVGNSRLDRLWLRGGLPRSYLARSREASWAWRQDFIRTLLERDLPQLGITVPSETLRRSWMMLAHYHGQIWNAADIARSLGVSENTARRYLDILAGAFMVRVLAPWWENVAKRQFKAPKVYVRDSGLLHALLDIESRTDLLAHPKYGASWEGFGLEQTLQLTEAKEAYFWGTHAGAELDLLVLRAGRRYGFEFKCADAPGMTKSIGISLSDLRLERVWIVYPGSNRYAVHDRVEVIPLTAVTPQLLGPVRRVRRTAALPP